MIERGRTLAHSAPVQPAVVPSLPYTEDKAQSLGKSIPRDEERKAYRLQRALSSAHVVGCTVRGVGGDWTGHCQPRKAGEG
jgi:hypothetical protein